MDVTAATGNFSWIYFVADVTAKELQRRGLVFIATNEKVSSKQWLKIGQHEKIGREKEYASWSIFLNCILLKL